MLLLEKLKIHPQSSIDLCKCTKLYFKYIGKTEESPIGVLEAALLRGHT